MLEFFVFIGILLVIWLVNVLYHKLQKKSLERRYKPEHDKGRKLNGTYKQLLQNTNTMEYSRSLQHEKNTTFRRTEPVTKRVVNNPSREEVDLDYI